MKLIFIVRGEGGDEGWMEARLNGKGCVLEMELESSTNCDGWRGWADQAEARVVQRLLLSGPSYLLCDPPQLMAHDS